jgi:hypothetical protein
MLRSFLLDSFERNLWVITNASKKNGSLRDGSLSNKIDDQEGWDNGDETITVENPKTWYCLGSPISSRSELQFWPKWIWKIISQEKNTIWGRWLPFRSRGTQVRIKIIRFIIKHANYSLFSRQRVEPEPKIVYSLDRKRSKPDSLLSWWHVEAFRIEKSSIV